MEARKTHGYTIPAIGTILLAAFNELPNPGATQDRAKMYEWREAVAKDRAATLTEQRITAYNQNFNDSWLVNYQSGRMKGPKGTGDPDAPPPVPPFEFAVIVVPGEAGGPEFQVEPGEAVNDVLAAMVKRGELVDLPPAFVPRPACAVPEYDRITAPQHYKG